MAYVRDKQMGRLVAFNGTNAQTVAPDGAEQWRHKQSMAGGGSLVDIGLYCLNTVRFLTGEEPLEVYASTYSPKDDPRFAQVEETIAFMMRFPSGLIANCLTTYGAREDKHHRLNLEKAVIDMPNAYQYVGQRLLVSSRQDRATSVNELVLPHKHQFAAEIDHMAECVIHDRKPYTPGEEGVQDHIIMEAIYHSASTNRPVPLQVYTTLDTFRGPPPTAES
jgi:predicted dehydrogenase